MASATPSPSALPPNYSYAKDPSTSRVFYIDHTDSSTSWIHPTLQASPPPNYECRIDSSSGAIVFVNHTAQTSSRSHPRHHELHVPSQFDAPLPEHVEQCLDGEGRHFYRDHGERSSSWMHPGKLAELSASGVLDGEGDENADGGEAWRQWVLRDVAECGLEKGTTYWVDYRNGSVDWQSPEDKRIARQRALERRAAREENKVVLEALKPSL